MNDRDYMALAINLASATEGQTSPNPQVGAVLVKEGQIIGMGAHLKAGEPHAEVHAISMAGENAEGATLYVSLEPCSHFGKTPPCSNLVIESGIKKVFVAMVDPNPLVGGEGVKKMLAAGLDVQVGLMEEEAKALNKVFFHYISTGLPYVTLKSATTLDGKIATVTGESQWITGEEARKDVHQFRHTHDAILVGVNTVINDNPSLTTRLEAGGKNPVRVVLDSTLRTPLDSRIINDRAARTIIVTGARAEPEGIKQFTELGIEIIKLETEKVGIPDMLKKLGDWGITSVYVEGGAEVHGSFLKEKAFQQVITYIAPKLLGGKRAPTAYGGEGIARLEDTVHLEIKEVKQIDQDIRIIAEPL
ncbi:bifunctional diaminohydroxyphosphoribosylaminopyrimidine deaminase/5-amino-6-(5-phosphoribosylamino)uracil reductase RibD [Mesobacillus subterraneus]|uniref:bifunctional diaminohydroxyphosphoribosylaminopyrimidine deaminase/5-amino-6-(5-phosphoribosylamino)uracil reductase RibD n=1 Tax=Mesobacillus subterraneus TaxID=285983 RepID=UPI00273F0422|nr:bifunctional diaminohydroxyphosphoribosylaminopyrimidine deaminase/5-amino-6-(5-phosphoribosylamino)uracil reductase RibD [Mesobacillus subterraneus]WLR55871.1 bifunctional diaminohydroxyphosphoribosylaminopyrimidine deaminase/5-amino-6-(5-phosphoribosylamino)uracil reductase RibD [Mesobacillus subterraneus]